MLLTTILLVPGIIAMIYSSVTYSNHAPMKVGIDYTGGTILQYGLEQKLGNSDVAKTRETLEKAGIENPYIQILNVNNDQQKNTKSNINSIISIRTKFIDKDSANQDKITEQLKTEYTNPELISVSSVGPTMGKELFKNSLSPPTAKRRQPRAEMRSAMRISDSGKLTEAGRVRTPSAFGLRVDLLSVMIKPSLF